MEGGGAVAMLWASVEQSDVSWSSEGSVDVIGISGVEPSSEVEDVWCFEVIEDIGGIYVFCVCNWISFVILIIAGLINIPLVIVFCFSFVAVLAVIIWVFISIGRRDKFSREKVFVWTIGFEVDIASLAQGN